MADYQLDAIFCPAPFAVIEASTKAGKTVGCMGWLLEQALAGKEGRNYWWVAPVYKQAEIAYRRYKYGLDRSIFTANESKLRLHFATGTILHFLSAEDPDSLYGEDVYAAVGDEITRWKEAAWFALRSTITQTEAPIRLIGNVKGRGNFAYKLARMAESRMLDGDPRYHYAKITALDAVAAGILSQETVDNARAELPDAVFRELYLAEPSDDGGNPFGIDAIAGQVAALSAAPPVAWGWDLAKSYDWTVGVALDTAGDVCRFERWQAPWEDTIRRIVAHTGNTPALVDSTGVGDPVLEALQASAPNIYEGFKFSSASKQQLMEGLAVAIQQRQIRYPEGPITAELETFEYEYTRTGVRYAAPEGLHDDCVMSLGLAVKHWALKRRDDLPYAWRRKDPAFRQEVLGSPDHEETDDERVARRMAAYQAAQGQ